MRRTVSFNLLFTRFLIFFISSDAGLKLFIAEDGTAALSRHELTNPVAGVLKQVVIEENR